MTQTQTDTLYRTPDGIRAHLRGCPHVIGRPVAPIEAGDPELPICRFSWTEINGVGRITQRTVDAGLRELGVQLPERKGMVALLKGVVWDDAHLPPSRAYLTLAHEGRRVAWAGRTYVLIGDDFTPLPQHRTGTTAVSELWGEPCDTCFQERARNGTCNCG